VSAICCVSQITVRVKSLCVSNHCACQITVRVTSLCVSNYCACQITVRVSNHCACLKSMCVSNHCACHITVSSIHPTAFTQQQQSAPVVANRMNPRLCSAFREIATSAWTFARSKRVCNWSTAASSPTHTPANISHQMHPLGSISSAHTTTARCTQQQQPNAHSSSSPIHTAAAHHRQPLGHPSTHSALGVLLVGKQSGCHRAL
jgi:hypothetical protein